MAIRLPGVILVKQILRRRSATSSDMPKGFFAVYVGDMQKRFLVPVSCLNQPAFQNLLSEAEEKFGFESPTRGLTIPCEEYTFINVLSSMNRL